MKKNFWIVLLSICMITSIFIIPMSVSAANPANKAIMLGTGNIDGWSSTDGYDYLYYGTYNNEAVKWRVLDNKTNTGADGFFLLSENPLEQTAFKSDRTSNSYQNSDVKVWCENFASNNLSKEELSALIATTKSDGEVTYNKATFPQSDNILSGDKVFLISAEEAMNASYGFTNNASRLAVNALQWWLRSPSTPTKDIVGYVNDSGGVWKQSADKAYHYARPAFNLNSGNVLFVSAAADGKGSTFGTVADYTGNEWKATLLDSSRLFDVTETAVKAASGGYASFHYTGAAIGNNEYISAMLLDDSGNVLYYGKLEESNGNGTAAIPVPEALADGIYRVLIFSEQCNGNYKTDYASAFEEITLTVETGYHTHDGASFTQALNDTFDAALSSGNYYLDGDISGYSITLLNNSTVNICLNGNTWNLEHYTNFISEGSVLNICDCSGGGGMIISSSYQGGTIENYGTLNIIDGSIKYSSNAQTILNKNNGVLNISGGTVISENHYAVKNEATMCISGTPIISGSNDYTDIYTANSFSANQYLGGEISVTTPAPTADTVLVRDVDSTNSQSFKFIGKRGYSLVLDNSSLKLSYKHEHIWDTNWTVNNAAHWHECLEENCTVNDNESKNGYTKHNLGELVSKVNSTCSNTGFEAHYFCEDCNTYLNSEMLITNAETLTIAIDSTAHHYAAPVYTWSDDCSTCTATRVCTHNSEHVETGNGIISATITTAQSCDNDETTKYTATFINPEFITQIKDNIKTKDKLGHDFASGTEYSIEADGHSKKCSRCDAYGAKQAHTGGTATYTERAECSVCHGEYGELASNNTNLSADNSASSENTTDNSTQEIIDSDDDYINSKGCGSAVSGAISIVAIFGLSAAFASKKKKLRK